ncbi:RDD family protein [Salimicrobium jeotgali]|uniref:RDD family protein n=1 Tax=Salimicrobium jeotgali TaxID=1230341 RepID=UPI000C83CD78|nr:RDD family protein [Salimicrobium jeotgali]
MQQPAGFWVRLGASILDSLIIGIILALLAFLVYGDITRAGEGSALDALSFLYSLLLPVFWRGYVIGKKLMGIRIVKVSGEDVTIGNMLLRLVVAGIVYVLTIGIGVIVSAFMVGLREDKRAIHDLIAGTQVIHDGEG